MRIKRHRMFFVIVDDRPRRFEDLDAVGPLNGVRPYVSLSVGDDGVTASSMKIKSIRDLAGVSEHGIGIAVGTYHGHIVFQRAEVESTQPPPE